MRGQVAPDTMRVRFTSPHPKDFPDELLRAIRDHPNVCKSIHLPAQSGSSAVLETMRRGCVAPGGARGRGGGGAGAR